MAELCIPLFSIRRGKASGLSSCVFNLISGICLNGSSVNALYTRMEHFTPEFLKWAGGQHAVVFRSFPSIAARGYSRFVEENVYTAFTRHYRPILFPNYFLPPSIPRT